MKAGPQVIHQPESARRGRSDSARALVNCEAVMVRSSWICAGAHTAVQRCKSHMCFHHQSAVSDICVTHPSRPKIPALEMHIAFAPARPCCTSALRWRRTCAPRRSRHR